jgi:hypothetical protein
MSIWRTFAAKCTCDGFPAYPVGGKSSSRQQAAIAVTMVAANIEELITTYQDPG